MELFKIEPGLAIWTWITFGILFYLLSRFAFPALIRGIRQREESIARSVDNAAQIEKRLAEIEEERTQTLSRSRAEADEILRRTRAEAEEVRRRLLERAEREAQETLEQARKRIEEERASTLASLRRELADFAVEASEKVIGRSFTAQQDREWARELAESL